MRELVDRVTELQTPAQLEDSVKKVNANVSFLEASARKRAAIMLVVGSAAGLAGFVFACVIGVISLNEEKQDSAFKDLYFPATVSEMVHDPLKPEGKVFFAFEFVGAILIFFSWYPTQLRNVYIGDDAKLCGVSWVTIRQFVPACGMMMLSTITTVPMQTAKLTDEFCIFLHLLGAAMMFVGYFCCEAHAVGWGPFNGWLPKGHLRDRRDSIRLRKLCLTGIAFFYTVFILLMIWLSSGLPDPDLNDKWAYNKTLGEIVLVQPAKPCIRRVKVACYGSEVLCGLLLICSHLVIWYYSEERHYDLPETLCRLHQSLLTVCDEESDREEDEDDESDRSHSTDSASSDGSIEASENRRDREDR